MFHTGKEILDFTSRLNQLLTEKVAGYHFHDTVTISCMLTCSNVSRQGKLEEKTQQKLCKKV